MAIALSAISLPASAAAQGTTSTGQGEYIIRAAGCVACHTDTENNGEHLAGGVAFETAFGTFYSPNITSDPEAGIGSWSKQDFTNALTRGIGPGEKHYYPVFPYTSYVGMKLDDINALFDYLQSIPASSATNRQHKLPWYLQNRLINWLWKMMFFFPFEAPADRGEYLVKALGHCDQCHTPRNFAGAINADLHLTGTKDGPDGDPVPNITPDKESGIGKWGRKSLARYLRSGELPDGDFAGGLMVDVIDDGLSYLNQDDIAALVDYLKRLNPVKN